MGKLSYTFDEDGHTHVDVDSPVNDGAVILTQSEIEDAIALLQAGDP